MPTLAQAVGQYASRMAIEETSRDWHRGWDVRGAGSALPTEAVVERLLGCVGLTDLLQLQLGQRLSQEPVGQWHRAQWTVTDRGRWCWCGQRLFDDPSYAWSNWLAGQWSALLTVLPAAAPVPGSAPEPVQL